MAYITPEEMLAEYHARADIPRPVAPTVAGLAVRCDYIAEELQEMRDAIAANDPIAVADAIGDLLFLVYGSAHVGGYPAHAILAEVYRSNMTKTPAPGDGKAIKGPGYTPPNLAPLLSRMHGPSSFFAVIDEAEAEWSAVPAKLRPIECPPYEPQPKQD